MNKNRGGRICGLLCFLVRKSFDALYEDDRIYSLMENRKSGTISE
jgi:hypothetical protein